jgi:Asp-tRNA(Asn)/Glu-tRNA(Gln) amidotransferase A subunit family amidase
LLFTLLCTASLSVTTLTVEGSDDPEIYHGAPVGVQLVARKFEEEKILAIAGIVTSALETYHKRSGFLSSK